MEDIRVIYGNHVSRPVGCFGCQIIIAPNRPYVIVQANVEHGDVPGVCCCEKEECILYCKIAVASDPLEAALAFRDQDHRRFPRDLNFEPQW